MTDFVKVNYWLICEPVCNNSSIFNKLSSFPCSPWANEEGWMWPQALKKLKTPQLNTKSILNTIWGLNKRKEWFPNEERWWRWRQSSKHQTFTFIDKAYLLRRLKSNDKIQTYWNKQPRIDNLWRDYLRLILENMNKWPDSLTIW